jgi:hypothetical protein
MNPITPGTVPPRNLDKEEPEQAYEDDIPTEADPSPEDLKI